MNYCVDVLRHTNFKHMSCFVNFEGLKCSHTTLYIYINIQRKTLIEH